MGKFTGKLMAFMYGRYGIDSLGRGLFVLYFILWFLNLFIRSTVLWLVNLFVILFLIFRVLSKNIARRRAENEIFLKVWHPVKTELRLAYDRIHDIKTNRYRKCRHCKAIIKLPNKRGTQTVKCPKCGEKFSVKIIFSNVK